MKLLYINLIWSLFLLLPLLNHSNVSATGALYGKVYMINLQGQEVPLKDAYINKTADCNNGPSNECQSTACLGKGYCPTKPQTYYTRPNGVFEMTDGAPTLILNNHNGEKRDNCEGDTSTYVKIACGINCGWHAHEFKAFFPPNYDTNNFPGGINLKKGHFIAATPTETFGIDTKVYTDSDGSQYYHLNNTNNDINNPNLDFKWVPDPLPIAGTVVDSKTGRGLAGVTMDIQNDQGQHKSAITGQDGKFIVPTDNFIITTQHYAVSIINVPSGYNLNSRTVTTTGWSWIYLDGGRNAAPPDPSYQQQNFGSNDCAGPDYDPTKYPHQTGRCNFKVDPIAPTASPSPSNKPTGSVTSTPLLSGTGFPPGNTITGGTISSTPEPTATVSITPECAVIDTTGSQVNAISVGSQRVNFNSFATLPIKLEGTPGQTNFVLPINVSYSNGACRALSLAFNYNPNLTPTITGSPTATPDPKLCAKDSNRPNGCACIISNQNQCQSNKCDPISLTCVSEPFIQTQGGDVHSNQGVQGK